MSGKKQMSAYSDAIYTTVTPILGGVVVILNSLELFMIMKMQKKKRSKVTNSFIFITNLCVSDIMVGIVMIILKSMDPYMKTDLKDDNTAKEFYGILKHVFIRLSLFISIFNLLALTLDRYLAITGPLKHRKRGKSFVYKMIAAVWFFSLACVILIYCISRFELSNVEKYNNMVFPISSYTTSVVFVFCYSFIYKVVRDSSTKDIARSKSTYVKSRKRSSTSTSEQTEKDQKSPIKQEIKLLRLAILTVGVFCICWLPFSTCNLLIAAGRSCGGKDVERTLFTLAFFNSVLNPIVYFLNNLKYVKEFIKGEKAKKYSTVSSRTQITKARSETTTTMDSTNRKSSLTTSQIPNNKHPSYVCSYDNEVFLNDES
uniref:G-protein coupled receptors family 1 profile domain-containing protein n=2 Tax=Clytia hemisphaerica TaxID=252671 RepID=A0A7M5WM37_9CNID